MRLAANHGCAFISLCAIWLLATVLPASAGVVRVRPDGTGDVPTIARAMEKAAPGDTVLLADGTFRGDGSYGIHVGPWGVTIRSESGNPALCVIDCEGRGRAFRFDTSHPGDPPQHRDPPRLEGVTITGGRADEGGAIKCGPHSHPVIENCVFRGNHADTEGGAIQCEFTELTIFRRCVMVDNSAEETGGAVALCCCAMANFENCTIVGNRAPEGSAFGGGMTGTVVTRTIIAFQRGGAAVRCRYPCSRPATGVICYANPDSAWPVGLASKAGADGNQLIDPGFEDVEGMDFRLRPDSPLRGLFATDSLGIGAVRD